jgi:hypothetical protein
MQGVPPLFCNLVALKNKNLYPKVQGHGNCAITSKKNLYPKVQWHIWNMHGPAIAAVPFISGDHPSLHRSTT